MANEHLNVYSKPNPLIAAHANAIYYSGIGAAIGAGVGAGLSLLRGRPSVINDVSVASTVVGAAVGLVAAYCTYQNVAHQRAHHEKLEADYLAQIQKR